MGTPGRRAFCERSAELLYKRRNNPGRFNAAVNPRLFIAGVREALSRSLAFFSPRRRELTDERTDVRTGKDSSSDPLDPPI